jgi:hypothetical protein
VETIMRLSEWRGRTPHRDSMTSKVLAVIEPMITAMGGEPDPECWVVWGDDPAARYLILVPTDSGLVQVHVRVNVPGEGPRGSTKLTRWNRLQVGELAMESAAGHRLLSFQVEGQVLRGSDDEADAISRFALAIFAAIDGRLEPIVGQASTPRRRTATKPAARKKPASPPQLAPPTGR